MQIKTTEIEHAIPVGTATTTTWTGTSVGEDVELPDPSHTAGWLVKYCSCFGKTVW